MRLDPGKWLILVAHWLEHLMDVPKVKHNTLKSFFCCPFALCPSQLNLSSIGDITPISSLLQLSAASDP